jgi:Tol biopolymer transport system component
VLVSTGSAGLGNEVSFFPSISADGKYVAFESFASNLVAGDINGADDIFVRDLESGTTVLVSTGSGGQGNSYSSDPSISADGRYVAFDSLADNLVAGDTNGNQDVFVRDLVSGTTVLFSTGSTGQGDSHSFAPSISADGRYVAFTSYATNLVAGDTNSDSGTFVRDLVSGTTVLVGTGIPGQVYNPFSYPSISADGSFVSFTSLATNLVAGDTNGFADIFRATTGFLD